MLRPNNRFEVIIGGRATVDEYSITMEFPGLTVDQGRQAAGSVLGHIQGQKKKFRYDQGEWAESTLPWSFVADGSILGDLKAEGRTTVEETADGLRVTVQFDQLDMVIKSVGWRSTVRDTTGAYAHFLGQPASVVVSPRG
jgi:hypothetical protein